ncbi:hypothetical protein ACS0TY_020620 [Phlomoides rotata]
MREASRMVVFVVPAIPGARRICSPKPPNRICSPKPPNWRLIWDMEWELMDREFGRCRTVLTLALIVTDLKSSLLHQLMIPIRTRCLDHGRKLTGFILGGFEIIDCIIMYSLNGSICVIGIVMVDVLFLNRCKGGKTMCNHLKSFDKLPPVMYR